MTAQPTKIFGVPLGVLMSRPTERTIPTFVKKTIRYLNAQAIDTEGLFRISAKISILNTIKQKLDAGEDLDFFEYKDPHLISGLLKVYLRELPEPLFTFALYPRFVEAATEYEQAVNLQRTKGGDANDQSSAETYIEKLSSLIEQLPPPNKALAEILLLFLVRVGEHSAKNKMTPANLAIVFGQILLRPEVETIESMMNASKITGIMKFMIEKFEKLFPKQKVKPPVRVDTPIPQAQPEPAQNNNNNNNVNNNNNNNNVNNIEQPKQIQPQAQPVQPQPQAQPVQPQLVQQPVVQPQPQHVQQPVVQPVQPQPQPQPVQQPVVQVQPQPVVQPVQPQPVQVQHVQPQPVQQPAVQPVQHQPVQQQAQPVQSPKQNVPQVVPQSQAARTLSPPVVSPNSNQSRSADEDEKLQRVKKTVDEAIVLVQKKLHSLSFQLKETDQLEVAIEIARRIRTVKKVIFPPGEEQRFAQSQSVRFTLSSSYAERQGKRKKMEDAYITLDNLRAEIPTLPQNQLWAFYAIYDGHGGSVASQLCSQHLHKNIVKSRHFANRQIKDAISNAFEETDKLIIKQEENLTDKDGSTAVVVLINNNTLYVANAGDSEAILCRQNPDGSVEAIVISEMHRPTIPSEKDRIENAGGAVFSGRVFGKLAVSRCLGDPDFKIPTSEANFVSSEPFVNAIPIAEEYKFILLACDGLFDKVEPQHAIEFLHHKLQETGDVNTACNALAELALERGSNDNVTIVLTKFNW